MWKFLTSRELVGNSLVFLRYFSGIGHVVSNDNNLSLLISVDDEILFCH